MPTPGSSQPPAPFPIYRMTLLAGAMVALLAGVLSGLRRSGAGVPVPVALEAHGPLMVAGFFGTLVALERAVAARTQIWVFAAPVFGIAGTFGLLLGVPLELSIVAYLTSAFLLLAATAHLWWQHRALFTAIMCAGAAALYVGHLLWLTGAPTNQVASLWMAFLIATIAGERLELSRVVATPRWAHRLFALLLVIYLIGLVFGGLATSSGSLLIGVSLTGLGVWLLRFDLARRTLRHAGQPRFVAVALLTGFAWLVCGGVLAAARGPTTGGPTYDAILHSVFIGFVFAMVFAHAPIIFPAVLGFRIAFLPVFYVHLALLELSVAARVLGDLAWLPTLRQLGVWGNAAALILFVVHTLVGVHRGRVQPARMAAPPQQIA